MTDGRTRRAISLAITLAALLPVAGYAASRSEALGQVRMQQPAALLSAWYNDPSSVAPIRALSDTTLREAISARPLDPGVVNVAMIHDVATRGDRRLDRWARTIAKLGWRNTPALQNRLYVAAQTQTPDLPQVLDISDALMRRRQAQDRIIPILNLAELDPDLRPRFVARLAGSPNWRSDYLFVAGGLKTPEQLQARYDVLLSLRRRGVKVDGDYAQTSVQAMIDNGMPGLGYSLWKSIEPGTVSPLNDPGFLYASSHDNSRTRPFAWTLESGEGFDADVYRENGKAALAIQWNGRGVPVFARQRTSATPGRYALDVDVAPENVRDLAVFDFRFRCADQVVAMQQVPGHPTRFVTDGDLPCSFPLFEIAGDIDAQGAPRGVEFHRLRLTRIGAAPAQS